ncbi:MAG: tetratricopeptide repeat protein, partial [Candidatus Acidiferrales bacterium]
MPNKVCANLSVRFVVGLLAGLTVSLSVMAQGARTPIVNPMDPSSIGVVPGELGSATVMIYLRDEYGGSPTTIPMFKVSSVTFTSANIAPPRPYEGGWVLAGLRPGDEYDIEVSIAGYKVAHQVVMIPNVNTFGGGNITINAIIYINPENGKADSLSPPSDVILAPRAEKEVQHGLKDLRNKNPASAQKHLGKALQMAPANPFVNYLIGMCYLRMNKLPEAKASLEKSVSIDPKGAPALLALGMLHYRESDYPGATQLLGQAAELDPTAWKADWMLASSYLHEGNFEKARHYSEKALKSGKEGAAPVELLLGEALAGLGEHEKAITAFETFLKAYPRDPSVAQVREWIVTLQRESAVSGKPTFANVAAHSVSTRADPPGASSASLSALRGPLPAPAVELPPKDSWAPPDIDSVSPPVVSAGACSLPKIMAAAQKSAEEFVTDLQKFSAIEEYESVEIKRNDQLETPETRQFNYLVLIDDSHPSLPRVTEVREQTRGAAPSSGSIVDLAAPALSLIFDRNFRDDFNWKCEGLGAWNNQPAWLVHFEQRFDRPTSRLQGFDDPAGSALLPLKGRAWISKSGGHVIRLETDMAKAVKTIDLKRDHFAIDYQPVTFRKHKVTLWLPENVDVYLQYQGHYLHHYHHFSQF